jgi:hypothetical protein
MKSLRNEAAEAIKKQIEKELQEICSKEFIGKSNNEETIPRMAVRLTDFISNSTPK